MLGLRHLRREGGGSITGLTTVESAVFALGPGLYDATIAACHEAGFSPRLGQEAPRIVSTLNLVAAGLGVALVPASLQHMRVDGIRYCALRGPVQPKALLAIASRRGDPSAAVRQFLKQISRTPAAP